VVDDRRQVEQLNLVGLVASGSLYIADTFNYRIRKVDTNGVITTVAGSGPYGYGGDGGAATQAVLARPTGVAVDASGNIYIADTDNQRVRRVGLNGKISTVVGNGTQGFSLDGVAATGVSLDKPSAVAVDAAGNLFFVETNNQRVREAPTDTTPPVITPTINGTLGGDGWYTSDVTLSWTVNDPESPVSSAQGCGNVTVNNDTTGVSFTCTATSAGGTSSKTVSVKRDATAPKLTLPNDITAELSGPAGAVVNYVASAADNLDPNPAFGCAPAPGSNFASGTTAVNCTATDRAGNTASGSFNVRVVDTTPPDVTAPAPVSAPSDMNCQAAVPNLLPQVTASDKSGAFTLKQNPAAGTLVGVGAYTINITATDGSNNSRTVTTTFTVVAGQSFNASFNPNTVRRGDQTTLKVAFSNCAAKAQALTLTVSLKIPTNGKKPKIQALSATMQVTLQAGQRGSLSIPFKIPKPSAPGLYLLTLDVYAGGVRTGTSTAQLTVTP
jgi:hypothetical protein